MISIIIPTLNGGQLFAEVLQGIGRQQLDEEYELLVYDSASTDNTVATARAFGAKVLSIRREDFDHGSTRTLAAEQARGDILVFMTQDAVPENDTALKRLTAPFKDREDIAATYGRQLPALDADVFAAHLRLHNYPAASVVRCRRDRNRYGFKTVFISNSFAAWRRDVLAAHGFFPAKQLFGEDTCALANLLENGYCVAYVSEARVYHSHNYSPVQDFRRYFDIGVFHACHCDMLEKFGSPTGAGKNFIRSEIAYLRQQKKYLRLPESIFRSGVKFIAYQLGKRYKKLPKILPPFLSLHRRWWS
ncbi:MAG: glycosyltransferase [Desulfobulbaceae bacterium]|nr:glycosyltransferase [Desulfobulbaceae bacterium]